MAFSKFSSQSVTGFMESRNLREKMMIVILFFLVVVFVDYWIWLRPVFSMLSRNAPQLRASQATYQGLLNDKKNKDIIQRTWAENKSKIDEIEKSFVGPNEIPALLENLSKIASRSEVKILSLNPIDKKNPDDSGGIYSPLEIRINAQAGTHEFGRFLAQLEDGPTFFKITDLRISENTFDGRKHLMTLSAEVLKK